MCVHKLAALGLFLIGCVLLNLFMCRMCRMCGRGMCIAHTCLCVYISVHLWRPEVSMTGVILNHVPPYFLGQSISLDVELHLSS